MVSRSVAETDDLHACLEVPQIISSHHHAPTAGRYDMNASAAAVADPAVDGQKKALAGAAMMDGAERRHGWKQGARFGGV